MFFNNKNNNDDYEDLTKVAALLIHAAKIDENYSEIEKKIIKEALKEIGANPENIESIRDKLVLYKKNNEFIIKHKQYELLSEFLPTNQSKIIIDFSGEK